jgi:hypothetical protein
MNFMDAMDCYFAHFKRCDACKPATLEDPVCVPCPTGQQLWSRYQSRIRAEGADAGQDLGSGPSIYPLGGFDEYHDD